MCDRWLAIESAPRDGTPILLWSPDGHHGLGYILEEDRGFGPMASEGAVWCGQKLGERRPSAWGGGWRAHEATHWAPLLSPPSEAASPEGLGVSQAAWLDHFPALNINNRRSGARFWELRQAQLVARPGFPPLTVSLDDDGRVRFVPHPQIPGGDHE